MRVVKTVQTGSTYLNQEVASNVEDNPYIKLIKRINKENKSSYPTMYRFGRVMSINPLKIDVENLMLEKDDFLKNSNITIFYIGDTLLLIPIEDEQRYVIVAKVVDA